MTQTDRPNYHSGLTAKRIVKLAMLGLHNSQTVEVWGGGLEGVSAVWMGFEEETGLVSVQTVTRMIHMPAHQLVRIEVG